MKPAPLATTASTTVEDAPAAIADAGGAGNTTNHTKDNANAA